MVPLLHDIAAPAENRTVVNAHSLVWNDKVFVDAENFSKSLASGTSTDWIVETEQVYRWLLEGYSVGFETVREGMLLQLVSIFINKAFAFAFEESCLHRVGNSTDKSIVVGLYCEAVEYNVYSIANRLYLNDFVCTLKFTVVDKPYIALL